MNSNGTAPSWVGVIIPARDEADTVAGVIAEVRAALQSDPRCGVADIVVVDDGSRDLTREHAAAAGARVLTCAPARGYGAALRTGILAVGAGNLAVLDADGTYAPRDLLPLLDAVLTGADQAIGVRPQRGVTHGVLRRVVKAGITSVASALTRCPIPDLNSGIRCFRRDRVEPLLGIVPDGFSFTTTLTIAALLCGWEVRWSEVSYAKRASSSKFLPVRDTLRLLRALLRTVLRFAPMRLAVPASGLLIMTAAALALAAPSVGWGTPPGAWVAMAVAAATVALGGFAQRRARRLKEHIRG